MAEATQITIATGTTAYGGDPESDERVSAREVRVEVTYQLAPEEDAALTVSHKAAEVERMRKAAWDRIQAKPEDNEFDPAQLGLEPPDDQDDNLSPFPEDADYIGQTSSSYNGYREPVAPPMPPEPVEWATRPQQLALRSHFTRLGMNGPDQATLLREHFGKFRVERLTKAEAALLMRTLERSEWSPNAANTALTAH